MRAVSAPQAIPAPTGARRSRLDAALEVVGDRWSLRVVEALLGGPCRFADLHEAVPGISTSVLSARLRRLERTRLVTAWPYQRRPPRLAYELTARGAALAGPITLLADWADADADPVHGACGARLELRWWCPSCEEVGERMVEDPAEPEVYRA
jgi:DNA-binding HxlR family transcriptional regulator